MSDFGDIPRYIGQKAGCERSLGHALRSTLVKATEVVFPSPLPADEGKCLHDAETKSGGSDLSSCNSSSGPTWLTDICIGSTPARCHRIEAIEHHKLPHSYPCWVNPLLDELQQAAPRCRSISQKKRLAQKPSSGISKSLPLPRLSENSAFWSVNGLLHYSGRGRSSLRGTFRPNPTLSEKSAIQSSISHLRYSGRGKAAVVALFGQSPASWMVSPS